MTTLTERLREATTAANQAARGTYRAHTSQTREGIAAMQTLGVKRKDYSVRVVMEGRGVYGPAHVNAWSREAAQAIIDHADELAEVGFQVWILNDRHAWMFTGWKGSVHRIYSSNHKTEEE